jgi:hypothetical protein
MQRHHVSIAVILGASVLLADLAAGHPTVPEHCFLNLSGEPVDLALGFGAETTHSTVAAGDFFCGDSFSRVEVTSPSGRVHRYDSATMKQRFPLASRVYQGYWFIRADGLHYVSRSAYIRARQRIEHTKT